MDKRFNKMSTVGDVLDEPLFSGFGRLMFPVDMNVSRSMTLAGLTGSGVYMWYSEFRAETTVDVLNEFYLRAARGERIFYPIYSAEERRADPEKEYTGLFFMRGEPGAPFAVVNAGGGFYYVAAMHDSFPHCLELSRRGLNAFALIYRPSSPWRDLARALCFIEDNASELGVDPLGYSLWGGSAGARMAAALGNRNNLERLTGRTCAGWREVKAALRSGTGRRSGGAAQLSGGMPQASAVIMEYTGYDQCSRADAPTYACVGTSDGIAWWQGMRQRLETLSGLGIPTEFHSYPGLRHGFGIGTGTVAEGWPDDAIAFWQEQI